MNACPSCRRAFPDGAETCLYCGRTVGGRCGKCGAWVRSDRQACPSCGEPWTLGMLQAAREQRKAMARRNTDELAQVRSAEQSDPKRWNEDRQPAEREDEADMDMEKAPLFPSAEYEAVCTHLTRKALKRADDELTLWVFDGLDRYAGNFIAMIGLLGLLPGVVIGQMLQSSLPSKVFMGLMIACPMVFGVVGAALLAALKRRISEGAGVTPRVVRREIEKQREMASAKR